MMVEGGGGCGRNVIKQKVKCMRLEKKYGETEDWCMGRQRSKLELRHWRVKLLPIWINGQGGERRLFGSLDDFTTWTAMHSPQGGLSSVDDKSAARDL